MTEFCRRNPFTMSAASSRLQDNRELWLDIIKNYNPDEKVHKNLKSSDESEPFEDETINSLTFVSSRLSNDREFATEALSINPHIGIHWLGEEM